MSFNLFIATDNSAFDDGNKSAEIARILWTLPSKFSSGCQNGILRDVNGNRVGMYGMGELSDKPPAGAYVMSFETESAAFCDGDFDDEFSRVIKLAAKKCSEEQFSFNIYDVNGNRIGRAYEAEAIESAVIANNIQDGGVSQSNAPGVISKQDDDLFRKLGFSWNRSKLPRSVPTHSLSRVSFRFHKMLPEFVWDASVLEGNPFTFPEVKTLLDGVSVGGQKLSDQEQVLNLAASSKHLLAMVKAKQFALDKTTFVELHNLVARNEALEWGHFRGEGPEINYTPDVSLGMQGRYTPLKTLAGAPELNRVFADGCDALQGEIKHPLEKAAAFFLFGALQQFFFDGNKRTSRSMMNGILMSAGIDAISVPAAKAKEFNENMVRFYQTKNANEMMSFIVGCHPDADQLYDSNHAERQENSCNGFQP